MPEDDLEGLLRRSLGAEADRIEPAGDGLRRIRERTARTRNWSRWRVPALALAGAAAAVAALVAAPSLLPSLQPSGRPAGAPSAAPTPGSTPIPGAGVNDVRTVWPYGSRAEGFRRAGADEAARTYGDLTKPDQVAVRFVGSYVGTRSLAAVSLGAYLAGLRMEVTRDGVPVSLVYLVRVRVGDDAPYVVVDAEAPASALTVARVPAVPASGLFVAAGTVAGGAVPLVQLRAPGQDLVLGEARSAVAGERWSAALSLPGGVPYPVLAAWTEDGGGVTTFAARPLG